MDKNMPESRGPWPEGIALSNEHETAPAMETRHAGASKQSKQGNQGKFARRRPGKLEKERILATHVKSKEQKVSTSKLAEE